MQQEEEYCWKLYAEELDAVSQDVATSYSFTPFYSLASRNGMD